MTMWTHYCPVDRAWISVGKDEPCNWCDKTEPFGELADANNKTRVNTVFHVNYQIV
jgi:hypothetical protein